MQTPNPMQAVRYDEITALEPCEVKCFVIGIAERLAIEAAHAQYLTRNSPDQLKNYAFLAANAAQRARESAHSGAPPQEMLTMARESFESVCTATLYVRSRVSECEHPPVPGNAGSFDRAVLSGDEQRISHELGQWANGTAREKIRSAFRRAAQWLSLRETRAAGLWMYSHLTRYAGALGDASLVAELQLALNSAISEGLEDVDPLLLAHAVLKKDRKMLPTSRAFLSRYKEAMKLSPECCWALAEHWLGGLRAEPTLETNDAVDIATIVLDLLLRSAPGPSDMTLVMLLYDLQRRVPAARGAMQRLLPRALELLPEVRPAAEEREDEPSRPAPYTREEVAAGALLVLGRGEPMPAAAQRLRSMERSTAVLELSLSILEDSPVRFARALTDQGWGARGDFFAMVAPMLAHRSEFVAAMAKFPTPLRNAFRARRADKFVNDLVGLVARPELSVVLRAHERSLPALAHYTGEENDAVLWLVRDISRLGFKAWSTGSALEKGMLSCLAVGRTRAAAVAGLKALDEIDWSARILPALSRALEAMISHRLLASHADLALRVLREHAPARTRLRQFAGSLGMLCGARENFQAQHVAEFAAHLPADGPRDVALLLENMLASVDAWRAGAGVLRRGWADKRGERVLEPAELEGLESEGLEPEEEAAESEKIRVQFAERGSVDRPRLAARSHYFRALLRPGAPWVDRNAPQGFPASAEGFEVFRTIAETNELPDAHFEVALELVPLADLFQFGRLRRWCEMRLLRALELNRHLIHERTVDFLPHMPFLQAGFRILSLDARGVL
ncbi:Hypothetical Protein FCC1311_060262 [Hondaea fermentalgiana]|uniref:BTB domain-containing protein n=1 Tax=Hondaea fermentalgiana TaxID=2315210 RepID=A0A2R5GFX6_9STRA|nr:Hypothetical Protein FCC1311_060262 [Hondaea fermentalgiana]|eukprot:GBG29806.1 Hypothetical Protein FCC1311_060262 [Hondaea fermentalgiana]